MPIATAQTQGSPAPSLPAPAAPQVPTAVINGQTYTLPGAMGGVPQTAADVAALRARGSELAGQLISARSRRDAVVRQIRNGDPDVQGLQQQVSFLDARVLQLETDISANSRLIANAAPGALGQPYSFPTGRMMRDPTPIAIVFTLFVLAPLALGYVWRTLRKPSPPTVPAGWPEHLQRMDRLEQAVDTIAIEIERISEGQRFLTKILSEREGGAVAYRAPDPISIPNDAAGPKALGAGPMEAIPLGERESVRVKREA